MSAFNPRALFLSNDGSLYSDSLICSGLLPSKFGGKPCPHAQNKQLPDLQPLSEEETNADTRKGNSGDLCPPCALLHLGALGNWEGHNRYFIPEELLPLRLFFCKQEYWFVVNGLTNDAPQHIQHDDDDDDD
jgi:hypothetical protein